MRRQLTNYFHRLQNPILSQWTSEPGARRSGSIVEVFTGILGSSNPSANGLDQGAYLPPRSPATHERGQRKDGSDESTHLPISRLAIIRAQLAVGAMALRKKVQQRCGANTAYVSAARLIAQQL